MPAGFVTRLAGMAIDLGLLSTVITTVTVLGQFIGQTLQAGVLTLRFIALGTTVFSVCLYILYFVGLHMLGGQTLGKRIMGVRLLRTDGSRVDLKRAVIRYIGAWLSLPLFWGYLLALIDNRRQTFHDRLADTIVIYYTIPQDEIGPLEQHLAALRIRREKRLAAEKAAMAASAAAAQGGAPALVDVGESETVPAMQPPID